MTSLAERIANRVEDEGAPVGIDVNGEVKVL